CSIHVGSTGIERSAALYGDDPGERPPVRKCPEQLRAHPLPKVRKIVGVVDLQVMQPVGTQASVVPRLVVRHYGIVRRGAHRPGEGVCQAPSETVREPPLHARLKGMIVRVAGKVAAADRVVSGEYGTKKDVRESPVAIR